MRKTNNLQLQTRVLPVLTQCYYDQIWKEEHCYQDVVNLIADLLIQTPDLRIAEICANFLLQSEDTDLGGDEESSSAVSVEDYQEDDSARQEKLNKLYAELRDTVQAFKTNETARRKKILKLQSEIRKIKFKSENQEIKNKANQQKILDWIWNIQTFVDKITNKYLKGSCQFQFKLKIMEIIAECADIYKIQTQGFFTSLQKYLQPKQTDVQQIMYALVKAVNVNQNESEIYQTVQTVILNFLNHQNTDDEMVVGINYITNVCKRDHEMLTQSDEGVETLNLIFSMTTSKGVLDMHESEKGTKTSVQTRNSVVQAARELLNFYREVDPTIIKKKYQNKESAMKAKQMKLQQGLSVSESEEDSNDEQNDNENSDEEGSDDSSSCSSCDERPSKYKIQKQRQLMKHWRSVLAGAKRSGRILHQPEIDNIRHILDIVVDKHGEIVENAYIDSEDDAVFLPDIEVIIPSKQQQRLHQMTEEHRQIFQNVLDQQNDIEFEEMEEESEYEDPTLHILTQDEIKEKQMYRDEEREKFAPIDLNSFQKKHKMTSEERRQHTADSKLPEDHKNHKWDRKTEKMQTKRLSKTNKEKQANKPLLMVLRSEAIRKKQARPRWQKIQAAKKGGKK